MGAVIQAFPSIQGLNGRSFAFAFIIVVHFGMYAAFTSINPPHAPARLPDPKYVDVPLEPEKPVEPPKIPVVGRPTGGRVTAPTIKEPTIDVDKSVWTVEPPDPVAGDDGDAIAPPVIVEPQIDARIGLREPVYPSSEIRLNHTGTTVLSVQVLANGAVGEVRLLQSSGYPKLDQAVLQVARSWRFIPGTSDGSAVAMWKQVPITFRLQN